ncbi:hypothetical protein VMCG_01769 [Cytospora schulzeri]|uniref:AB hydrolase-1 domain-containing protein n=1 Tax=Cytospora schulzeri TaxID=448051 RepID=A0A423X431_9PEZI|nr:hypothetical protein VMCG_01769 [Valsa malicola]
MASNTTFILVPGAWHPASSFSLIMEPLKTAGYNVVGINLASCGAEPPLDNFKPDVDLISRAIEEAAEKGQDVVLFMHSYGGVVGAEACRGLGKEEREASGKKGGVVRLIYCCAFVIDEGFSVMDMLNNQPFPWFVVADNGRRVTPDTPKYIFYNDLSHEEAQKCVDALAHHSYRCFSTKVTYPAYKFIPTTYLYCTKDNALVLPVQEDIVEGARKSGVNIDTVTLEASHSPFLSIPDRVVAACLTAIGQSL